MATKSTILLDVISYAEEKLNKKFIPGYTHIPASYPELLPEDVASLVNTALDCWYTEHVQSIKFKHLLEMYLDKKHCVLANSGSSASLVAMSTAVETYDTYRDYVLTSAVGFPTTVSPIYQNGKIPLYVDIDPYTLTPDLDEIDYALNQYRNNICGAIFAHNLGFPYDEATLSKWLKEEDLFLISDACDALGASLTDVLDDGTETDKIVPVGHYSDMMTLSFFPAHHLNTAEGGAVLMNDDDLHEVARSYVQWGKSCFCYPGQDNVCGKRFDWDDRGTLPEHWDHKYIFDRLGYNLKMTDLQAALGVSQMLRISQIVNKRVENFNYITSNLFPNDFIRTIEYESWSHPSPFGVPIFVEEHAPFKLDDIVSHLEKNKIGTRRLFGGNLTRQPGFMHEPYIKTSDLRNSDLVMNTCFWVSCSPTLTMPMKEYMIEIFDEFLGHYK